MQRAKPAALRVLDGTARGDKLNPNEPRPGVGMPTKPAALPAAASAHWDDLAPELVRVGMLTVADGPAFGAYCRAWARWNAAELALDAFIATHEEHGGLAIMRGTVLVVNPLVTLARAAMTDHLRHAIELGLTPSARVKLSVDPNRGNPTKGFLG